MENRTTTTLRSRRVCRFCLCENEPLHFIYERDPTRPFQVPLSLQIMSCVSIEVYAADGMPQMICKMCRWNLDRSYKFKLQCKKADDALRAYPATGVLPRPFPPITNDSMDASNKRSTEQRSQSEQVTKKPRVDNGDRDRERRERQESTKSDREEIYKEEHSEADEESMDDKSSKLEPGEIRVHACDQCDRTFPLRQALVLHIQRAHRDRTHKCTECDRMFFSKYDLQKHMSTHAEEKPYSCSICQKTFTRANLLARHEKIHHEDMRYSCQHCDREFFTREDLEKHEDTSHKSIKPFSCNICSKRFTYKQSLERHEMQHSEDKSFTCEYCKEAFRTSTKLARHLQTHAGHRPYLCKLCPRDFLLSHHLSRHMRTHSVEKRHICEECGKAFKRKESLEVHQLTHSKRTGLGLTCDVCQESCRNRADYVTHIKQHIEAGEKMGPDGLSPEIKEKLESESEEEEEEEQFSDGDDDYEPPASLLKKYPKQVPKQSEESEEEPDQRVVKEEPKEQVVFVRAKDGQIVKKTIKTMLPTQRKETPEARVAAKSPAPKAHQKIESPPKGKDETEAEVQKIVASVFQEHKVALKASTPQEPAKVRSQVIKEEKIEGTPKTVTQVTKRIIVRKPAETPTPAPATPVKEDVKPATPAVKSTKRVIVRKIIRKGNTEHVEWRYQDGTEIDSADLAKLTTGQVVKRVVKTITKPKVAQAVKVAEQRAPVEAPKFELKTSQASATITPIPAPDNKNDKISEKVEQLEKTVAQQRLQIEELRSRKDSYEPADDMLPDRHDSEDEQELPLKRVFVKTNQSIYDEEKTYDADEKATIKKVEKKEKEKKVFIKTEEPSEVEQMSIEINSMIAEDKKAAEAAAAAAAEATVDTATAESEEVEPEKEEPMEVEQAKEPEKEAEVEKEKEEKVEEKQTEDVAAVLEQQDEAETSDIFDAPSSPLEKNNSNLDESVVALSQGNDTINLNDTNDSQDSLEDKLSRMDG
ncbi:uncharacterized protein LOC123273191 [Cotesia glomerata]|uniref:Uncharacterized protein n=1 Tax=Cotesia glomerata TaxID=32391 RepID=A0AAV7J2G8_COTGL|nr:uncharacterized protein LOC123273191 [Cotesia glomerata]KAH0564015.1 hypothetical protein KQX54_008693 [Cotesia glomerata]